MNVYLEIDNILLENEKHPGAIISLVKGDITSTCVDAIVNSANETLLGDDGVDGAINIAAGPSMREYCSKLGGCKTGQAIVTPAFNLPCKMVVHTVGPQYGNEVGREEELLRSCYRNSLLLADERRAKSIAFPSISTGQYGYPIDIASLVALSEIKNYLQTKNKNLEMVIIVLYPENVFNDNNLDDFVEYIKAARKIGLLSEDKYEHLPRH